MLFRSGETSKSFSIGIPDNSWDEPDKRFYVQLTNPANAVLVPGQSIATVTITDTWQKKPTLGETVTLPDTVENITLLGNEPATILGNNNNNIFTANGAKSNTLDGQGGMDTFSYAASPVPVVVQLQFGNSSAGTGWGGHWLKNFENVIGSPFDDKITGSADANQIQGGAGKDMLTGGGGSDRFNYKNLSDSLLSKIGRAHV